MYFGLGMIAHKKVASFSESFLEVIEEEYEPSVGAFFDDGIEVHGGSTVF